MTKLNLQDLAERALHTFWQSFTAALVVVWAASGIDLSQITDVDSAKKIGLAAISALAAAALSAIKTTVAQLTHAPKWTDDPAEVQAVYAAINSGGQAAPVTPADPQQPAAGVPPPPPA